ncbi:DNA-formamidopyrimidine glycosylase [soil metagenome]
MPELAEVETVRKYLDKTMRGKKIKEVEVDLNDKYLFAFAKPADVKKSLEGAKVIGTGRRGKYFWLDFNRGPSLIIHLGMSGNVSIRLPKLKRGVPARTTNQEHLHIWDGIALQSEGEKSRKAGNSKAPQHNGRDREDRPEHLWFCRLLFRLSDGSEIALLDPRRFGRVWLSDDPLKHPRIAKLGPDPLIDFPSVQDLFLKLHRRKTSIKAALLDQSLFAGIGNWLADEILFQAKMSPHRKASDLTPKDVAVLRKSVLAVVKKAVSVSADYERFPKTWLFHHRWGKSKTAKISTGAKIIHESIGGRTAAWVPSVQK